MKEWKGSEFGDSIDQKIKETHWRESLLIIVPVLSKKQVDDLFKDKTAFYFWLMNYDANGLDVSDNYCCVYLVRITKTFQFTVPNDFGNIPWDYARYYKGTVATKAMGSKPPS